ncbi:hypothetical protein F0562_029660 [Nyssa sinensis]|uniref:Uncharacterized protein n=1 Tax=Nyssa sinensis TaxID=561372 RepID=A0A5J5B3L5_9ASTE|nr:hypothetical protein F0562_029660 [Nyssa sinensis]
METMMSEMRRVMKLELKQVHERIDQMENAHEKLQNAPNVRRRESVQPREMRVEDEEPYGTGFDEEDDRDSVVGTNGQVFLVNDKAMRGPPPAQPIALKAHRTDAPGLQKTNQR